MADTTPSPPPPPASATFDPPPFTPMGERIAQLTESQTELLARIQGMKQEVQKWRSTLDTQVKAYKVDILELKKELNSELNQLRIEFKELNTNLQVQQNSLTSGRRNLIKDDPQRAQEFANPIVKGSMHKAAAAAEEASSSDTENQA
ncbi:uncharacterized protein LOC109724082 isoform X3 [Ananas comosus]|uniref:Uncharacterized protein LOC109724082 isoform X3 n=1 Tax=Ananas comosus TaxID=4615 RepID=A0A6P5GS79_ANACO|nr:uncharacterized protein LOC109724082 isoform X3 [Ananas comosus]